MKKLVVALTLGGFLSAVAQTPQQITLDFTGAQPGNITTFYQQQYQITFSSNALVWDTVTYNPPPQNPSYFGYVDPNDFNCATSSGGNCTSLKKPFSQNIVLQGRFGAARNIVMNVPLGLTGPFSFQSGGSQNNSQVRIYSGLNGTGTLLATIYVPASGSPARNCQLCHWSNEISLDPTFSVTFRGVGKSVVFDQGPGGAGYIEYDNVSFTLQ